MNIVQPTKPLYLVFFTSMHNENGDIRSLSTRETIAGLLSRKIHPLDIPINAFAPPYNHVKLCFLYDDLVTMHNQIIQKSKSNNIPLKTLDPYTAEIQKKMKQLIIYASKRQIPRYILDPNIPIFPLTGYKKVMNFWEKELAESTKLHDSTGVYNTKKYVGYSFSCLKKGFAPNAGDFVKKKGFTFLRLDVPIPEWEKVLSICRNFELSHDSYQRKHEDKSPPMASLNTIYVGKSGETIQDKVDESDNDDIHEDNLGGSVNNNERSSTLLKRKSNSKMRKLSFSLH